MYVRPIGNLRFDFNAPLDSIAQKKILREQPKAYLEYRKMIEAEIGQRFRFLMKRGPEATQARQVHN